MHPSRSSFFTTAQALFLSLASAASSDDRIQISTAPRVSALRPDVGINAIRRNAVGDFTGPSVCSPPPHFASLQPGSPAFSDTPQSAPILGGPSTPASPLLQGLRAALDLCLFHLSIANGPL